MAQRPGTYQRNRAPASLPSVGITESLTPRPPRAANPMFLQNTESPQARDLAMLQKALGGVADIMGTAAQMSKTRRAAQYGSNLEEGKKTGIEWITQVDNGPSDDASNAHFFPPDAYKMPGGEVVNPWVTPEVDKDGNPELDPLWDHALGVVDSMTDGLGDAAVRGYREGFALPYYKALLRRRQKIATEYNSEITKSHIEGLLGTQEDGETPMHELGEDEIFRLHMEELGMYDPEGNPVQPFNATKEAWKSSHILAAAELAEEKGLWDIAEAYVVMGEGGDPIRAAKLQTKIDTGRSDDNLSDQRDLMGLATSEYVSGVRTDERIADSGLPLDIQERLIGESNSAMEALANKIGVFYYTQGGSSDTDRMAAFKTSIDGSILAVAQKYGPEEAIATINELLLSEWRDPETGEMRRFAPEGSELNRDLRKSLNTQINNARTSADSQFASTKQEMQIVGLGIIHNGLDEGKSAEEIREHLVEVLGSIWAPASFGDIATAMNQRENEIDEGVSEPGEPGRITWESGPEQVGFREMFLNARDQKERLATLALLHIGIGNGFVNSSRLSEASQIMREPTQYDQARNHPIFTAMMDSMTGAFELTLRDEGDAIINIMDTRFIAGKPRVQQLGQAMMKQWGDFVKTDAMHKLWTSDRDRWELAATEQINNMRKAWWPVLGVAVRDIVETGKGPDAWTGSVNALEGVNADGKPNGTYWVEDNSNGQNKIVMQGGKATEVKVVVSDGLWRKWVKMRPGEVKIPIIEPNSYLPQGNGATN